jgi:hypothetical protein
MQVLNVSEVLQNQIKPMWVSREDKLVYDGANGKLDEEQAAKTHGILIVKNCIYRINETGVRLANSIISIEISINIIFLGMTVAIERSECADTAEARR